MLACLPASGDPTVRLLSRTQMNTGLQKWETTQKMRSASNPTPAELDAFAKKVADSPLSIQIFPNSVKVPQRKHVRRTVNGLDTSSSSQRHSPYPSQVSSSRGLLAVLRAPAKESSNSRSRQGHRAAMNPHGGAYATQSTLSLPQPAQAAQQQTAARPQAMQRPQTATHPVAVQQPHPQALQQRSVAHAHPLPRQQQTVSQVQTPHQQRPAHPQGMQRQQALLHGQALQQQSRSCPPQQHHLSHLQTLKHQPAAPQASLAQQGATQDLRRVSDGAQRPSLQHAQGPVGSRPLPQAVDVGPPTVTSGLQQPPPPGPYGPRKLPDADAPPNVTVSTSTIPLSMAAGLHQSRHGDLSTIVHQINQLCQARAGMGATSVCEGQIANPSPISRNLLINASSRVSSHHPALSSVPNCLMGGAMDKPVADTGSLPAFHPDPEKLLLHQRQQQQQQQQLQHHMQKQKQQQLQQQHLQLQQLQQQQRSWAQHQLAHMQQPPEGAHPCKNPRMEPPGECAFPSQNLGYAHKPPAAAQKRASSPGNCPVGSMPYINGHYLQQPWGGVPATAGNNGSSHQDHPVAFQRGQAAAAAATDRIPGAKYRPGKDGPSGQAKLVQNEDFLGGGFPMSGFQEQNMDVMEKMHRSAMGQVQEPNNGGGVHAHHPGYR
ncbi:protein FAM222B [Brachionichthys hirsutus]|uniref:protein FAM222B n=1 Tax=Brachionichthys hirsutus TaxID=412623 RepID=UPI0036045026